jgi:hypothetical protein
MKPQTSEPWARDALLYTQKTGDFEQELNNEDVYDDESALDSNHGYTSQVTATGLERNASIGGQPTWDSSPLRHTPHPLRGIKPVTRTPSPDLASKNRANTRVVSLSPLMRTRTRALLHECSLACAPCEAPCGILHARHPCRHPWLSAACER